MVLDEEVEMLPNVSGLSLSSRGCVPCGTFVTFRTREEQWKDYQDAFAFRETLEDQVDAEECSVCSEKLGDNPDSAVGHLLPPGERKWVEFCGSGHYIHKWCAYRILRSTSGRVPSCPDCRRPMTADARAAIAESYPRPAPGAAPPAREDGPGNNWEAALANARERNERDAVAAVSAVRDLFWQPNRSLFDDSVVPGPGLAIDLNNAFEHLLNNWTRFPLPDRDSAAWRNLEALVFESIRVFVARHLIERRGVWDELRRKLVRFLALVLAASPELRESVRTRGHWRDPVLTYLEQYPDAPFARGLLVVLQRSE